MPLGIFHLVRSQNHVRETNILNPLTHLRTCAY